jgi:hypothetical protein
MRPEGFGGSTNLFRKILVAKDVGKSRIRRRIRYREDVDGEAKKARKSAVSIPNIGFPLLWHLARLLASLHIAGRFIHILLVIGVIALVIHFFRGSSD